MILIDQDGREVEVSVEGDREHPEIVDAVYVDGDDKVSDATLNYLARHYQEELSEAAFDLQIMRAEAWADALADR